MKSDERNYELHEFDEWSGNFAAYAANGGEFGAALRRVIANAVKQSREKAYGKQLIWIASFLANRRFDNAKRVNDAKRVKRQR